MTSPTKPHPPGHSDSVFESLGKAITDPVREAADEQDEAVKKARRDATPDPYPDEDAQDAQDAR